MVQAAYSSGKPAYGVGAGNSSIVIDETADIDIAAQNTRISKTSDFGSGCSADGNIIIQRSIYDQMVAALEAEGGYLCNAEEKALLEKAMWDEQWQPHFPNHCLQTATNGRRRRVLDPRGSQISDGRKSGPDRV